MNLNFLDFEQPIAELEAKIAELRHMTSEKNLNLNEEIQRLENKNQQLTEQIFSHLTTAQVVQIARHPQRPYLLDYIPHLFTDFDELQGDRHYAKGISIVSGLARFNGEPVMIIGHQKGRTTKEKVERNFGMPNPEDYRKALRLMQLAEKFQLPIFTFVDTPGAYPGIGAEERNQSEAIARNLLVMAELKTPIICTITGEGGSGGALAIAVGDRVLMLQYSIYGVISPEGCASILWKSSTKAPEAAEAMGVNAERIYSLGLVDQIVPEPLGGAHRNLEAMAATLKKTLEENLSQLKNLSTEELLAKRYAKWISYGNP